MVKLINTNMKRMLVVPIMTSALLGALLPGCASAQPQNPNTQQVGLQPKITEVGRGVYAMEMTYQNSLIVIGDEHVLVMDTHKPVYARAQKAAIATLTDKPVSYVVYSHAHKDHIEGSDIYNETALYIAQQDQVPRLNYFKNDNFEMPDIVFDREFELDLGNKIVQLKYFGENHGGGVTFLYLPEDKVITTFDIAYKKRWHSFTMSNENPLLVLDTLREILDVDFELAITGHGPFATKADVKEHADFFEDLITQIRAVHAEALQLRLPPSKGVEMAIEKVDTSKYDDWGFSHYRNIHIQTIYSTIHAGL